MDIGYQHIKEEIQKAGLRATKQRIELLKLLKISKDHPSAEILRNKAIEAGFDYSIGTIYNTLDCLEKKGIIRRLFGTDEIMRYDYNTDFHVHLIDENNHITDIDASEELQNALTRFIREKLPNHKKVSSINLNLIQ